MTQGERNDLHAGLHVWREATLHLYPQEGGGRWVLRSRRHSADWHWDRHLGSGEVRWAEGRDDHTPAALCRAVAEALLVYADRLDGRRTGTTHLPRR